jgi:aminobenzoyl-glutamate utilization protein B
VATSLGASLNDVGPPAWSEDDKTLIRELSRESAPGEPFELDREIKLYDEGWYNFIENEGKGIWPVPLGRVN